MLQMPWWWEVRATTATTARTAAETTKKRNARSLFRRYTVYRYTVASASQLSRENTKSSKLRSCRTGFQRIYESVRKIIKIEIAAAVYIRGSIFSHFIILIVSFRPQFEISTDDSSTSDGTLRYHADIFSDCSIAVSGIPRF